MYNSFINKRHKIIAKGRIYCTVIVKQYFITHKTCAALKELINRYKQDYNQRREDFQFIYWHL